METITISKKEYRRLLDSKKGEAFKEAKRFAFSKKAEFIGMWKENEDIVDGASWVREVRNEEDKRSQNL